MIAGSIAVLAASLLFGELFGATGRGNDEHPRPQFKRASWESLNGVWEWAEAKPGEAPPFGEALERRIRVPFPVESKLSGVSVSIRGRPRSSHRQLGNIAVSEAKRSSWNRLTDMTSP